MDEIPFVKVSIEEAKAALQGDMRQRDAFWSPNKNSAARRASIGQEAQDLTPAAFQWLAAIPARARPYELAKQFPRIANRLAECWNRPQDCESCLNDLMMDSRGDRKGFPQEVAAEIATLRGHFLKARNAGRTDVWDRAMGAG